MNNLNLVPKFLKTNMNIFAENERNDKKEAPTFTVGVFPFFFLHVFTLILKAKGLRGSDIPKTIPPGESDDVNIESQNSKSKTQ